MSIFSLLTQINDKKKYTKKKLSVNLDDLEFY